VKEHGGLIRLLAESGVDFIVIGGVAGALLGAARATFDLDVVYSRREENLARLASALTPVHVYLRGAPPGLPFRFDLPTLQRGLNFTLTTDLGNLDILGEVVGGGGYEQLLPKSHEIEAFGARFRCIDLDALIAVKRAAGRPKDFEAIAELEIIRDERSRTAKDAEGPREPTTRGDG
jgi:hypothetical protein